MPTFDVSGLPTRPIKPNPGGQIDPGDHIGHGDEYLQLESAAGGAGALLTGDRRMGKSSMLTVIERKLRNDGHRVVRVSAETEYFETFVDRLESQVKKNPFGREQEAWSLDVDLERYGIRVRRESGKKSQATVEYEDFWDWAIRRAAPNRLMVILDEITVLAYHLQRKGADGGLEMLRSLKRARDLPNGPVMIFAGSIGLHHALSDFTVLGGMNRIAIGPLKPADATHLARCLLQGAGIEVDDESSVAQAMVDATDGIAFYIHHLANLARLSATPMTAKTVEEITAAAITSPDDPWELRHYDDRIDTYFPDEAGLVRRILDTLATTEVAPSVQQLLNIVNTAQDGLVIDSDRLGRLLDRLERDHYLVRDGSTGRFASDLLRRAWLHIRRL